MALCSKHNHYHPDGTHCGECWNEGWKNQKAATKVVSKQIKEATKVLPKTDQSNQKYNEQKLKSFRSKGKYQNVSTEYNGLKYDSKLEAKVAQDLDWKLKAGEIKEWRRQVKIPLEVNQIHIANYFIDFVYTDKYDQVVYLEVKGLELPLWRVKWRLLMALINEIEPGAKLVVVKA